MKRTKIKTAEKLQTTKTKEDKLNTPSVNDLLHKYAKVKNAKTALRLLSKIIEGFIKKEVDSRDAKDAAYLLSVYVQLHNSTILEKRIDGLEGKLL